MGIDLTRETPVSVDQVEALFGVCRRTVENWFADGLEKTKLGGRVFTTREALQRFSRSDSPASSVADPLTREERELSERYFGQGKKEHGRNGRTNRQSRSRPGSLPVERMG